MRRMMAMLLTLATLLTCVALPAHAVRYCGYCGASVYNDNYVFCSMCGKRLDGQSSGTQNNGQSNLTYSSNGYLMGYTIDRLSTRSGPGTTYSETGSYNNTKNTWVEVSCRAWDSRNEIWWVQVHIGNQWLWTGYKRFDSSTLPLESIPVWGNSTNGGSNGGTNNGGNNTGMADIEYIDPAFGWLLGQYVKVGTTGSARSGPGTNYTHKTTLLPGEGYTILDVSRGDTRKDWYKIRLSTGEEAWAASGLFLLNGVDGGTVWGVPD